GSVDQAIEAAIEHPPFHRRLLASPRGFPFFISSRCLIHIRALGPSHPCQFMPESLNVRLRFRVTFRVGHQDANPPHLTGLLPARRERPRGCRAAECSQQLPPSDGDCHTPLPCEVRKGNDTTPRACCPNSAAPRGGPHAAQAATERPRPRL